VSFFFVYYNMPQNEKKEACKALHMLNARRWVASKLKESLQQLVLLVWMKSVQKLGIFTSVAEISEVIVQHIVQKALLPLPEKEAWKSYSSSKTAKRHVRFVRNYFQTGVSCRSPYLFEDHES